MPWAFFDRLLHSRFRCSMECTDHEQQHRQNWELASRASFFSILYQANWTPKSNFWNSSWIDNHFMFRKRNTQRSHYCGLAKMNKQTDKPNYGCTKIATKTIILYLWYAVNENPNELVGPYQYHWKELEAASMRCEWSNERKPMSRSLDLSIAKLTEGDGKVRQSVSQTLGSHGWWWLIVMLLSSWLWWRSELHCCYCCK